MVVPTSTTDTGMETAKQKFIETLNSIDNYLRNLQNQLNSIVWKGQSRTQFDTTLNNWQTKFQPLYTHLETMAQFLGAGAADYRHSEEDAIKTGNFFH
jgi:WXG100 family type VII secretion target